ncbi:cation:proton antiporter [Roseburia sp. AM16-25]|uniref:cation:proton antiporter n=1 Tax=Roseburia sp. AM16-25 TaxID=2292065 RepID=UPI000E4C4440|nr:cation:proton antiporter [Roseburia sp. AM16-25]MDY3872262.1 cation:proton antiporter [Roseburia lenta]RHO30624.1 cation:proton antiporter [Roseburia sp. AM16-25]
MNYEFLLWIALILISTKVLGLLCKAVHLPEVVGALLAGVILGPSALGLMSMEGDTGTLLTYVAEMGVIFLMFSAGLDTDLKELKANIGASFVTALIGVIVPLIGGMIGYALYFGEDLSNYDQMLQSLFVGVVLTATSVSITVETLREMGRLSGKVGMTILGAAIIDDILGMVVLAVVSSMKDTSVKPTTVLIKIVLYFVLILILFMVTSRLEFAIEKNDHKRRVAIFAIAFCFILAYVSEIGFGIADITGAYFAGVMLCQSKIRDYVDVKIHDVSTVFFSCIFFASVGLKVTLGGMTLKVWMFAVILTLIAIISKMVGCGLGAKICKFTWKESLQTGVGMISRGEVALIVAEKGRQVGLISEDLFAPIILVVIVTTLITPILLKVVFKGDEPAESAVEKA